MTRDGAAGGERRPGTLGDPTAQGRHLDGYLAAVALELQARGVLTGSARRTEPAQRLLGSIVLDCTAVRVAAWSPPDPTALPTPADPTPAGPRSTDQRSAVPSLGGAIHPDRPAPVIVTWDEEMGWCVGLHHDSTRSSRRFLHSAGLPAPAVVAEFVVGLALGQPLGSAQPPLPTRWRAGHGYGCSDESPIAGRGAPGPGPAHRGSRRSEPGRRGAGVGRCDGAASPARAVGAVE